MSSEFIKAFTKEFERVTTIVGRKMVEVNVPIGINVKRRLIVTVAAYGYWEKKDKERDGRYGRAKGASRIWPLVAPSCYLALKVSRDVANKLNSK
jgi:hypothetical protein